MSERTYPAFVIDRVVGLAGADYYPFVMSAVARANRRVWAAIFLADIVNDDRLLVRELLDELVRAAWRGVDVRVLAGTSRAEDIAISCNVAVQYLQHRGVSAYQYKQAQARRSLHSKYVVIDSELVLVGSHNWTQRAFAENTEASVALQSRPVTAWLAREFAQLWEAATEGR